MAENISKSSLSSINHTGSNSSDKCSDSEKVELMLLEDAVHPEIPCNVKKIIASMYERSSPLYCAVNSPDIVVALVFVLMVETGFLPKDVDNVGAPFCTHNFHKGNLLRFVSLPTNWKTNGAYKINFILPTFPEMVVKMVGFCSEASLLINLVNVSLGEGFTTCVQPSRYVIQRSSIAPDLTFLQNLKELSKKIKDEVTGPSRSCILQYFNIVHNSLAGLPQELLLKICGYLPAKSLVRLSQSCSSFKEICDNSKLWETLTRADFRRVEHENVSNWKEEYKGCFLEFQRLAQQRRQNRMRFRNSNSYFVI